MEYISREDVLKKAKLSISVPADNEWDCGYNTAMAEMQEFIKQLPSADVQPVNQWISVKDRLPDKFDYVLCYCKTTTGEGNVFMYGAYHNDTWWLKTCRTYATLEQPQMRVMYWMPLPEPPKDGEQNENN
jgi:hypothetical protein